MELAISDTLVTYSVIIWTSLLIESNPKQIPNSALSTTGNSIHVLKQDKVGTANGLPASRVGFMWRIA